jgi:hypothetical protein
MLMGASTSGVNQLFARGVFASRFAHRQPPSRPSPGSVQSGSYCTELKIEYRLPVQLRLMPILTN